MEARLAIINVPSADPKASRAFYEQLLGLTMARSLTEQIDSSYHAPGSAGVQVIVNPRQTPDESVAAYFAVADLGASLQTLQGAGGQIIHGPTDLPVHSAVPKTKSSLFSISCHSNDAKATIPMSMGKFAIVRDPGGNLVGLLQLDPDAERFFPSQVSDEELVEHQQGIVNAQVIFGSND